MAITEINQDSGYISCRMPKNDINSLDSIAQNGDYLNRSDVIRSAVRKFIELNK